MIRSSIQIIRRAGGELARRPGRSMVAVAAIGSCLLLLATVLLAAGNVGTATASWRSGVQMVVYLEDGAGADRARQIQDALEQLPAVAATEYIAPEQALDRLRANLGEHEALAAEVEPGLLPASIEVALADGVKDVAAAHPVIERLENVPGVEDVEFLGGWVEQMTTFTAALDYAAWFLSLMVGLACAGIAFATLRLSLARRRDEAATLELLGASRRYIRAPMLLEGAITGALGGGLATVLAWGLYRSTSESAGRALTEAFGAVDLSFLPASDVALVVGVGATFGVLGAWFATGQRALAQA